MPAWPHAGNTNRNVVHACVSTQDGVTRIVGISEACQRGETAKHWKIAPQGQGFRIVDANGLVVGPILGAVNGSYSDAESFVVAMQVGAITFGVSVDRTHIFTKNYLVLLFESVDCTGPAYLLDDQSASPLPPSVITPDGIAFVGNRSGTISAASMQSFRYSDPSNGPGCYPPGVPDLVAVPTLQVDLSVYAAPFALQ